MKSIFARFGIPEMVVSDNMPFNSYEFKKFAKEWDFESVTSSPHFSQSNGQAEAAVSIAKSILKKSSDPYIALMEYRCTPLAGIKLSPSQMRLNRRIRTKLPVRNNLLEPKVEDSVREKLVNKQFLQKSYFDRTARPRASLCKNDNVLIKQRKGWDRGIVIDKLVQPRSYM